MRRTLILLGHKRRKTRIFLVLCLLAVVFLYIGLHEHINYKFAKYTPGNSRVIENSNYSFERQTLISRQPEYIIRIPSYKQRRRINSKHPEVPFFKTFNFLLENQNLCRNVQNLSIVFVMESNPSHIEWREVIRKTWTNESHYPMMGSFRVLFLFGKMKDNNTQALIEKEFNTYGDILQGDFVDDYRNLTYSTIMGWQWLSEHCRNAKLIMKADDDIVVDIYTMWSKVIYQYLSKKNSIFCRRTRMTIQRNSSYKWYMDDWYFSGQRKFPIYCEGKMVLMTNDMIPMLYKSSLVTPFIALEDVFAYALVLRNLPQVKINYGYVWGRDFHFIRKAGLWCLRKVTNCSDYVLPCNSSHEIVESWNIFKNRHTQMVSS